ncbi:uncharacterized protein LOC135426495 isoform X2 [Drosophila montana]|uniref:uncharacterized protein LOC135426495 isoform X2 n=1 Tax=Drosophila montana TaxID=40370 RepID=UPI00313E0699
MSSNSQITTNDVRVKLPEWLKAELFEQLLKDTFQSFKAIKSFKAMPGTKPGDNYATVMLRIELEVELSGYWTVCGVMAGSLLEDTQTASFDNLFSNTPEADEFRNLLYSGKIYKEHLKLVLPWLQNRGALQTELR